MKKSLAILLVMAIMLSFAWTASATGVTVSSSVNGTEVTVTGAVTDGASNQQITIMVVKAGVNRTSATESDIAYINQNTFAGSTYSFVFEMPSTMQTGSYDVYVGGTGVSSPATTTFTLDSPTAVPTEVPATAAPTEVPATAAPAGATVTGTIEVDTDKYTVTATANGDSVGIVISEGTYTISLPTAGDYEIAVSAPTAITYTFSVTASAGASITGPTISLILGDFDNNGKITGNDVAEVMSKIGATGVAFNQYMDLDNNNKITGNDVAEVMSKIGSTYSY